MLLPTLVLWMSGSRNKHHSRLSYIQTRWSQWYCPDLICRFVFPENMPGPKMGEWSCSWAKWFARENVQHFAVLYRMGSRCILQQTMIWGVITLKLSLESILEVFLCLSENMVSKMPWFVIIVFRHLLIHIYIYCKLQMSPIINHS